MKKLTLTLPLFSSLFCLIPFVSFANNSSGEEVGNTGKQKPNVLLITIDDLNTEVGFLGSRHASTPKLDALASQGTVFSSAHVPAPICNPSRTSFLTGMYLHTTGIYGLSPYFWEVPEFSDLESLPEHFRNQGYFSTAVGKIYVFYIITAHIRYFGL